MLSSFPPELVVVSYQPVYSGRRSRRCHVISYRQVTPGVLGLRFSIGRIPTLEESLSHADFRGPIFRQRAPQGFWLLPRSERHGDLVEVRALPPDRKSTRLNSQSPSNLVCRLLLEKKDQNAVWRKRSKLENRGVPQQCRDISLLLYDAYIFLSIGEPPISTLFPHGTLFRS